MKVGRILLVVGLMAFAMHSCKKDIDPVVTFTVVDTSGTSIEEAYVITHPCLDGVSCDTSRVNPAFVTDGFTNSAGQITYTFPYSAIIDVFAIKVLVDDTVNGIYEALQGQTVARFERVRDKDGTDNTYNVKVVVRETRK
jgi:hypothetical protein